MNFPSPNSRRLGLELGYFECPLLTDCSKYQEHLGAVPNVPELQPKRRHCLPRWSYLRSSSEPTIRLRIRRSQEWDFGQLSALFRTDNQHMIDRPDKWIVHRSKHRLSEECIPRKTSDWS